MASDIRRRRAETDLALNNSLYLIVVIASHIRHFLTEKMSMFITHLHRFNVRERLLGLVQGHDVIE